MQKEKSPKINDEIINEVVRLSSHNDELKLKYNDVVNLKKDVINEEKINAIDISQITKYISEKYSSEHNTELFYGLVEAVKCGKNNIVQHMLEQTLTIKTDWVDAIQDCILAMERIVNKPKLSLREEQELVKIERAKRVDATAVRHLSTHTQYIKVVRDDGSVVPSKIMTRNLEEEWAIYENRFLYALLQRMKTFVNKRYNIIMQYAKVKDNTTLSYVSNFKYGSAEIDCRLNVGVKIDKEADDAQSANAKTLKKLQFIKDQIAVLEASQFMRIMKKAKPIYPPIQKTNILKSNPEYSVCYKLWLMLSSYNTVGYSVNIIEKDLPIDNSYFEDVTKIVATSTQVMLVNNKVREAIYAQVRPTKMLKKEFKVKKSVGLTTKIFEDSKAKIKDVHEFYYERMKAMILHLNDLADALSVTSELEIPKSTLFKTVYTQIQKINKEMFDDVLKLENFKDKKYTNSVEDLTEQYDNQKKLCERYKQLKEFKQAEVKKAMADEVSQEKKLKTLASKITKQKQVEKIKEQKAKQAELRQKEREKKKALELERKQKLKQQREEKARLLEQKRQERARLIEQKKQEKLAKEKERLEKLKLKEQLLKQKQEQLIKQQALLQQKAQKEQQQLKQSAVLSKQEEACEKVQPKQAQEQTEQVQKQNTQAQVQIKKKSSRARLWHQQQKAKEKQKIKELKKMIREGIKESKNNLLHKGAKNVDKPTTQNGGNKA